MDRILVIGGGVGGTLVANLISRKLKRDIDDGQAEVTVIDEGGNHVYQPGFMYIALGNEKPASLVRPERSLLDHQVQLVVGAVENLVVAGSGLAHADMIEMRAEQNHLTGEGAQARRC